MNQVENNKDAKVNDMLVELKRVNSLLAELTFSEWIPKNDAASLDINQRIKSAHQRVSSFIYRS